MNLFSRVQLGDTKRWGMLGLVNQLFKIYFKVCFVLIWSLEQIRAELFHSSIFLKLNSITLSDQVIFHLINIQMHCDDMNNLMDYSDQQTPAL